MKDNEMFCLVKAIEFVNLKTKGPAVINHNNRRLLIKVDIKINTVLIIDSAQFSQNKTINTTYIYLK